jgi:hypothetical protein
MSEQNIAATLESDRAYADKLLAELGTKSQVIRYLTAEGWQRGRIAKAMNIIYQHVRNVQMKQLKKVAVRQMVEGDL